MSRTSPKGVAAIARLGATERSRRQRGSAILEQAFVLPVMLAVLFGAIDMSRALYAYHYVGYIAREATRWASVRSTMANGGPVGKAEVDNFVKDVTGMGLDQSAITTDLKWISPPNLTPLCPAGLTSNDKNRKPGCIVQVTVSYNFRFIIPLIPSGGFMMSSESQMIITQ